MMHDILVQHNERVLKVTESGLFEMVDAMGGAGLSVMLVNIMSLQSYLENPKYKPVAWCQNRFKQYRILFVKVSKV